MIKQTISIFLLTLSAIAYTQTQGISLKIKGNKLVLDDFYLDVGIIFQNNTSDTVTFLNANDIYRLLPMPPRDEEMQIDSLIDLLKEDFCYSEYLIFLQDEEGNTILPDMRYDGPTKLMSTPYEEAREWAIKNGMPLLEEEYQETNRYIINKGQITIYPYQQKKIKLQIALPAYYYKTIGYNETYFLTVYYLNSKNYEKKLNKEFIPPLKNIYKGYLKTNTVKVISKYK